jgi:hypothetical protein
LLHSRNDRSANAVCADTGLNLSILWKYDWFVRKRRNGRMIPHAANLGDIMNQPKIARGALIGGFASVFLSAVMAVPVPAMADEGGVSFWLPGLFGSLAAAPQQPGWSLTSVYYHTSVSAGADVARAREFEIGRLPVTATANISASLDARADLAFAMPNYTFATPVFGGQLTLGAIGIYGRADTSLAGTVTGALATPLGTFPFSRFDSISDSVTGFGDVWPMARVTFVISPAEQTPSTAPRRILMK